MFFENTSMGQGSKIDNGLRSKNMFIIVNILPPIRGTRDGNNGF
jgi:hypothetical protein